MIKSLVNAFKKRTAETVFKGIVMTKTLVFTFAISATIIGCKEMNTHYASHDMAIGQNNTAESVVYKANDAGMN